MATPARLVFVSALLLEALAACQRPAIEWGQPDPVSGARSPEEDVAFDAQLRVVPRSKTVAPPPAESQCAASVRVAKDRTGDWYAVWWSVRRDSTADVVVAHSNDGSSWGPAVRVDTTDAGHVGCQRPPPAIVADAGNVHVAYAMTAREGPGIFASHSMDRGMLFHAPVVIVYGERLGRTAIAARGDDVAVVYEDPNSNPQRIGLAFSRTMGHTFESREIVSPPTGEARSPAVALSEGRIAVAWERDSGAGATPTQVLRYGTLR